MSLLAIHKISVILFLLIYVVKTILLLANKTQALDQFKRLTKVPEMIVSTAFLVTGIWMFVEIGSIKMFQIIKLVLVVASIPLAVVAYKKSNKALAVLSLFFIIMAYGLAEMSKKQKAMGANESELNSSDATVMGPEVYTSYCVKCHGDDGKKGLMGAVDLSVSAIGRDEIIQVVSDGRNTMTPYKDVLNAAQIEAVSDYVMTLRK